MCRPLHCTCLHAEAAQRSQHAWSTLSGTAMVLAAAANGGGSMHSVERSSTLIEGCSASPLSFLAGFGTNGWLWLEFYVVRSVWRSGYSHYTSKPRQKLFMWR